MTTFAFIFARGGSKGLPGKNVKPLLGIPLLTRAINVAQQVSEVDNIFVSTDCAEIAQVASLSSVEVISRPPELATDTAPEWLAWKHSIQYVTDKYGEFSRFLSLPTTCPLRTADDVQRCLDAFNSEADLVLTVTEPHRSPWFNMVKSNDEGFLERIIYNPAITRRQDTPLCFDVTTLAYVTRPDYVLNTNSMWSGRVLGVSVPKHRSIDIDDYYDFVIAEALMRLESSNTGI